MQEILDELDRIILGLERISKAFETGPLHALLVKIDRSTEAVGKSSSNSWHGYQASLYLRHFEVPSQGEHFNSDWGFDRALSNTTRGDWVEYTYEDVEREILRRAGVQNLEPLKLAASDAEQAFIEGKGYLNALLDVVIDLYGSDALRQLKVRVAELPNSIDASEWIRNLAPRMLATRDQRAQAEMTRGPKPPHHLAFQSLRMHFHSYGFQAGELSKLARHVRQYLEARRKIEG